MAQSQRKQQREMKNMMEVHGRAHTKVAGDDEMLRTGFHNGTPLEAGKVAADSDPVDLFAPAHRLAAANNNDTTDDRKNKPSEPTVDDQNAGARGGVEEANDSNSNRNDGPYYDPSPVKGRQGIAEPSVGGRRLGRQ